MIPSGKKMSGFRVFISSFQCESNTFCKTVARYKDFDVFYGDEAADRLAATKFFRQNNVEVTAGVFASALPSGKVDFQSYERIADAILQGLKANSNVDGVYLYLHGAMYVNGLGSGEEHLVSRIRGMVGEKVPIAVALDFHANNTDAFVQNVNIIQGFRTAPHTDQDETEMRAASGLIRCIKEKVLPKPAFLRVPILAADAAITANSPLKEIVEKLCILDNAEDVYSAAFFNGQPWVDAQYVGASAVIMYKENETLAYDAVDALTHIYWQGRKNLALKLGEEVMMPKEAIEYAFQAKGAPVFITDSGDNTTAGAEGEGTLMLSLLMAHQVKNALVCAITAKDVVAQLIQKNVGEQVEIQIGENAEEKNIVPVHIKGEIKSFGKVLGWAGEECGNGVTISCGDIDVVLTDVRAAFISREHIENMGVNVHDYQGIVLKLGYLFPKLRQISNHHIFALTPGASTNLFETLDYRNIRRPMYPLDRGFEWVVNKDRESS